MIALPELLKLSVVIKENTYICLYHKALYIGTGHKAVTPYSWEGNRRFGAALAMHMHMQRTHPAIYSFLHKYGAFYLFTCLVLG